MTSASMEARAYLARLAGCDTFAKRSALIQDVRDQENAARQKFSTRRATGDVEGTEDPFLSLISLHDETPALMTYQSQVYIV